MLHLIHKSCIQSNKLPSRKPGPLRWKQCHKKDKPNRLCHSVMEENGLERVEDDSWDILLICGNKYGNKYWDDIKVTNKDQILGLVHNIL